MAESACAVEVTFGCDLYLHLPWVLYNIGFMCTYNVGYTYVCMRFCVNNSIQE